MAQLLIAKGININQTNKNGNNALMLACRLSNSDYILEIAHFLIIDSGIKLNQKDKRGNNVPMTLCEESTRDEIVEVAQLFVDNGTKYDNARGPAALLRRHIS